jgi:sec-independent protein translocase protein TatA
MPAPFWSSIHSSEQHREDDPVLADIIGPDILIVIAVALVVLLFGGSKLPKLARGLGSASHEFRKGLEEGDAQAKAADAAKDSTSAS